MAGSETSKALKRFMRRPLAGEHMSEFLAEITNDSDRAVVITLGTYVEDALKDAIKGRMRRLGSDEEAKLFGPDSPLGTFSAKLRIAYALEMIDEAGRNDLDRIRDVRNAFAHSIAPISFRAKEVADVCLLLNKVMGTPNSARVRFISCCLGWNLHLRPTFLGRKRSP